MTAPIRVLVVDDEPLARRGIRVRLSRRVEFELVAEASDAEAGAREIGRHRPQAVFLDIEMPGADGFALLDSLPPDDRPLVIFVTAHDDRALQAFDCEAFDYVLKPIDDARFDRTLDRIVERLSQRGGTPSVERLIVRDRGRAVALEPSSIDWVRSDGDYVRIHAGVSTYLHHATLTSIAATLPAHQFARVHRTAIVNLERIQELEPLTNGDYSIRLTTGARLKLSRTYRSAVAVRLGATL